MLADTAAVALQNFDLRGALSRRIAERDEAAERADELECAVHTLVHDLRNPLGAILGYADLISESTADAAVQRYADTIVRVGERLSGQVDRLLAVFGVTSRRPSPEPVSVSRLARRISEEHVVRAGRAVQVEVQDGIRVLADPVLVEVVLDNLIGNAVTYSGHAAHPRVRIAAVPTADGFVEISVDDNGVGFEPADAALLFRPFTRLHPDADFPGTALGLASVARVVRQHGGTVSAEGRPGHGATFRFTLPAVAAPVTRTGDGQALVA